MNIVSPIFPKNGLLQKQKGVGWVGLVGDTKNTIKPR